MIKTECDQPKVLYVDDSESNLLLFKELFKNDFFVLLASSAKEGLEILREEEVAVLVSDQSMPEMSGNELLEIASAEFPELLSFILTAYTDYDSLVESVNKGKIYGYFNKPINYEQIKLAINRALEVSSLRANNKQMIRELEKANRDLLELDKSRTKFLGMITNEIRSPINKIMSAVHMIKDKVDSHDITELLNLLDNSVLRLESFSFATNQLASLKDDDKEIEKKYVSLRELIEISYIAKKNALDDSGISVKLDAESSGAYVKGDYDLLLSCLGILIMYLVNSMEKGGAFFFSTGQKDQKAWLDIRVEDSGYSKLHLDNLKEIFSGNDNYSENYFSLELVLSREIIASHKGEMRFESNGHGMFTASLIFPAAQEVGKSVI